MLPVHLAPHVLPSLVSFLTGWLKNRSVRQVELTIGGDTLKLTGATHQDQESGPRAIAVEARHMLNLDG
jgi:hypothetical protein